MASRTLAQLEASIRFRYDLVGNARHPQADIFRLIYDAYRSLREKLTSDNVPVFLTTEEWPISAGFTAGHPGTILSHLANPPIQNGDDLLYFTTIAEVHVRLNGVWVPLQRIERNDALNYTNGVTVGPPRYWCAVGVSEEVFDTSDNSSQGIRVLIVPGLDRATTFRVIGLRAIIENATPTTSFFLDFGAYEYIEIFVGRVIAQRDDDVEAKAARDNDLVVTYKDLLKRMLSHSPSPVRRADTAGRLRGRCRR
jgi:hypothetical protein